MPYTCTQCGQQHGELPAIGFDAPHYYYTLNDEGRKKHVQKLTSDLCILAYTNQTDYFIRTVLRQKIHGHDQELQYGVWVSVSERSFKDYTDNFAAEAHTGKYMGYLSTWIPGYETTTVGIVMRVQATGNSNRPTIIPQQGQDHPFVNDYYNGITMEEAEARVRRVMGE